MKFPTENKTLNLIILIICIAGLSLIVSFFIRPPLPIIGASLIKTDKDARIVELEADIVIKDTELTNIKRAILERDNVTLDTMGFNSDGMVISVNGQICNFE